MEDRGIPRSFFACPCPQGRRCHPSLLKARPHRRHPRPDGFAVRGIRLAFFQDANPLFFSLRRTSVSKKVTIFFSALLAKRGKISYNKGRKICKRTPQPAPPLQNTLCRRPGKTPRQSATLQRKDAFPNESERSDNETENTLASSACLHDSLPACFPSVVSADGSVGS